jgi:hypothetical protein
MRYLKSYKLFEAFVSDIKFFRFSREEMSIGEYTPVKRSMWGPENFNQCLVRNGFPDKNNCVHFMDAVAFNPDYKGTYGSYIYEIAVNDKSNLGWCFVAPINDCFFKTNHFDLALRNGNQLVKSIMETPFSELSAFGADDNILDEMIKYLLDYEIIGCGTIDDLKKSPHFGKEKLFVWTNDTVVVSEYKVVKEPKIGNYKTERALTNDDFISKGLSGKDIANFYQSELGKSVKGKSRDEALSLLDQWINSIRGIKESVDNEFATEEQLDTVEDILLPISDLGFSVEIHKNVMGQNEELEIDSEIARIYIEMKDDEWTKPYIITEDMIEVIDRLCDYVDAQGYVIDIDCIFKGSGYLSAHDWSKVREINHEIDYIKIMIEYVD